MCVGNVDQLFLYGSSITGSQIIYFQSTMCISCYCLLYSFIPEARLEAAFLSIPGLFQEQIANTFVPVGKTVSIIILLTFPKCVCVWWYCLQDSGLFLNNCQGLASLLFLNTTLRQMHALSSKCTQRDARVVLARLSWYFTVCCGSITLQPLLRNKGWWHGLSDSRKGFSQFEGGHGPSNWVIFPKFEP